MTAPPLLFVAMRIEALAVAATAPGATVVRTGIGPRRAAEAARRVQSDTGPGRGHASVSIVGVGGALVEGIAPGDLVVADRVLTAAGEVVAVLATAVAVATALRRAGLVAHVGAVVSTDHLVTAVTARAALAELGALAVDMESAALLRRPWPIPTVVVRAVADHPGAGVWSPASVGNGWRALRSLRAAVAVLAHLALDTDQPGGRVANPFPPHPSEVP